MLDVRTGDLDDVVDEKNFFVGRVKRNLFSSRTSARIFTDGHPARGQSGQTYGADMRLATSRFLGASRNFVVNAYGVRSVNDSLSGKDWSYGFSAHYPNDVVQRAGRVSRDPGELQAGARLRPARQRAAASGWPAATTRVRNTS